jgi:hypothetical protein
VVKTSTLKIGDRFKDKQTGKIYIVTTVFYDKIVIMEGENGLGRRITDQKNLNHTCEKVEDKES